MFAHAADVQRDFGTPHFVINNAGVPMTGTFDHMSLEEIEWQLNINLWGVIYGNMAFLPMLLAQREGCIVNMSSTLGLVGLPIQSAYNIAKFGVRGLTESLWSELDGTGVRAVCVLPGGVRTNLDKGGRLCAKAGLKTRDTTAWQKKCRPPRRPTAQITFSMALSAATCASCPATRPAT